METQFTGRKVWVVGKWNGNVWVGKGVFRDYERADKFCDLEGFGYSIERMYEIAGENVSPQTYWLERGRR